MLIIIVKRPMFSHIKGGSHTKLNIGKRNIKTAIAVFLSVLISKLFKLEYPFLLLLQLYDMDMLIEVLKQTPILENSRKLHRIIKNPLIGGK